MEKGEVLEITIAVIATEDIHDVDALDCAANSLARILPNTAKLDQPAPSMGRGLEFLLALKKVKRFTSGVSIRSGGRTRYARKRRHTIYGRGSAPPDDSTPPTESKPS